MPLARGHADDTVGTVDPGRVAQGRRIDEPVGSGAHCGEIAGLQLWMGEHDLAESEERHLVDRDLRLAIEPVHARLVDGPLAMFHGATGDAARQAFLRAGLPLVDLVDAEAGPAADEPEHGDERGEHADRAVESLHGGYG